MPTHIHQTYQEQSSQVYNSAARTVDLYVGMNIGAVLGGDIGTTLIHDLTLCLNTEGRELSSRASAMTPHQRWQAVSMALFSLDMLERLQHMPIRRRTPAQGECGVMLNVGAAIYLLATSPHMTAAERALQHYTDYFGQPPAGSDIHLSLHLPF